MQKIDVAVGSYRKPESLIYTLLTLKKHCGQHIDTIYINDDCSGEDTIAYYKDSKFLEYMKPINIKVRVNKKRAGFSGNIITSKMILNSPTYLARYFVNLYKGKTTYEDDIKYQYAINTTDKKWLLIIHDDIKFLKDIIAVYRSVIETDDTMAIVGDLGQCWNCGEKSICNPREIMKGYRPSKHWPLTRKTYFSRFVVKRRECRINEWCCMLNVEVARKIGKQLSVFFGNSEHKGDTAAYWFYKAVKSGYRFFDPLPEQSTRDQYYLHCWQGYSGHSVWVDQGNGVSKYNINMIRECLSREFGLDL